MREFVRNRRLVHRGDVITYGPNIRSGAYSSDAAGFRHSSFAGATLSVDDCLQQGRYGLVLGSSHVYGIGLAGNENTIPSLLAERLGFPFGNVSLPEASGRNLYALLTAFVAGAPNPPSAVVYFSGGDFTSFCFTTMADAVFGSPNLKQIKAALAESGESARPANGIQPLLRFTTLWTRMIAQKCRARQVPLVLAHDTTFFEKRRPNALEIECDLGKGGPAQERLYATHKRYFPAFLERREKAAAALRVPLAGPGASNGFGFIDEFHYDRDGARAFSEDLAKAIEPLL